MAALISDLVHQYSSTTGTGDQTLTSISGKRTFNVAFGTGGTDLFYYFISNPDAAEWEFGTGHLSSSTVLVRDTVLGSSNSGSLVNFSSGTKDITNDLISAQQVSLDTFNELMLTTSLLALQVADNTNVALFLGGSGNRVFDSFDALTYVDVAGATNLDTTATGILKPEQILVDQIPTMTAATTSGVTMSADSEFAGYEAWRAGNKITGSVGENIFWQNAASASPPPHWLKADLGSAKTIVAYTLRAVTSEAYPIAWTFEGSNNDSAWSALDTRTGQSFTQGEVKSYTIASPASYRYYRLYITSQANIVAVLDEITMLAGSGADNMTVCSEEFTAAVEPSVMKAVLRIKEVDAADANDDYTLEFSRDDGTTWTPATLTELFTSPSPTASIRVVESNEVDVSGQPSGTSPRWRFKTINNDMIELHDVALYWR